MSMLAENKVVSMPIERFREGQAKRRNTSPSVTTEVDEQVSWKQILITFGSLIAAGSFFVLLIFAFAFASLLF